MVFLEKFAFTIVYHFLLTLLLNNKLKNDLSVPILVGQLNDFQTSIQQQTMGLFLISIAY